MLTLSVRCLYADEFGDVEYDVHHGEVAGVLLLALGVRFRDSEQGRLLTGSGVAIGPANIQRFVRCGKQAMWSRCYYVYFYFNPVFRDLVVLPSLLP